MHKLIKENIELFLSAVVLFVATIYFVIRQNYEFLIYSFTLTILIIILYKTDKIFGYIKTAKWGFFTWMVMHMAGGSVYIKGTRLYDIILIPFVGEPYNILKYDQFVHFYCYLVMTLLFFSVLLTITKKDYNKTTFMIVLILAASSIGALNEIIEFSAVILFESSGVGGYFNTAVDLVANLLGAIVATFYLRIKQLI